MPIGGSAQLPVGKRSSLRITHDSQVPVVAHDPPRALGEVVGTVSKERALVVTGRDPGVFGASVRASWTSPRLSSALVRGLVGSQRSCSGLRARSSSKGGRSGCSRVPTGPPCQIAEELWSLPVGAREAILPLP